MEYKILKRVKGEIKEVEITSDDQRYLATLSKVGSDWIYDICRYIRDCKEGTVWSLIGTVVIDRPDAILDAKARKAEILQTIGNRIFDYEKQMVKTVKA